MNCLNIVWNDDRHADVKPGRNGQCGLWKHAWKFNMCHVFLIESTFIIHLGRECDSLRIIQHFLEVPRMWISNTEKNRIHYCERERVKVMIVDDVTFGKATLYAHTLINNK